jgi:hypothetical protein
MLGEGSMVRVAVVLGLMVVLSGLGLAACGGSDRLSAKDYRARLAVLVVSKHQGHVDADLKKLQKAKTRLSRSPWNFTVAIGDQ